MKLVLSLFLILVCFTSCDTPYILFVENNTNKDIEVFVKSKIEINFDSLSYSVQKVSKKDLRIFNFEKTMSNDFNYKTKINIIDSLSYSIIIKPRTTSLIGPHPLSSPFKSISYLKENKINPFVVIIKNVSSSVF